MKGRRYTHLAASSPSLEEGRNWLVSPAAEGGMSAQILPDFDSEVRKVLACFDPPAPADLNKEAAARKGLRDTLRTLNKGQQRKSCPERANGVVHHERWTHCTLQRATRFNMDLALTRESVLS